IRRASSPPDRPPEPGIDLGHPIRTPATVNDPGTARGTRPVLVAGAAGPFRLRGGLSRGAGLEGCRLRSPAADPPGPDPAGSRPGGIPALRRPGPGHAPAGVAGVQPARPPGRSVLEASDSGSDRGEGAVRTGAVAAQRAVRQSSEAVAARAG